jgi:hypothetical protein
MIIRQERGGNNQGMGSVIPKKGAMEGGREAYGKNRELGG